MLTQQTQMYKGFVRTINSEFIVPKLRDKGGLLYGGFRIEAITGTRIKRVIIIHPSRAAVPSLPPRSSNDSTPKRPGAKSTYTNRVYIVIKFVSKPNYIERTAREEKKGRKKKKCQETGITSTYNMNGEGIASTTSSIFVYEGRPR